MKKFLMLALTPLLIGGCSDQTEKTDERPNILLIVADDLGYSDIGAFGSEISTPNLDKLAAEGVKLSNFYAAAACSPTRSMLLSGADSHVAGMGTMYNDQAENQIGQPGYEGYMNHNVVTVSSLLKDAGYHTYMTGKWHLGYEEDQSPAARDFERSFAILQGGGGHFDDAAMTVDHDTSWYREDGVMTELPDDFFSSRFYTDKMMEYISADKDDGKPFFAYLAYTAPHWPLQAPDEYLDKYKGRYDAGYDNLAQERLKSLEKIGLIDEGHIAPDPAYPPEENWENLSDEQKRIDAREMEIFAAMVDNMDYHIGRIIDYLEKTGERDNTVIIFMSDNGAQGFGPGMARAFPQEWIDENFDNSFENMGRINSYIYLGPHWARASTAPMRMFKGFSSEGGIKVPAIINYPGKFEGRKGEFLDQFATVLDLPVTFLDLAKHEHPGPEYNGRSVAPYIGTSMLPFINGEAEEIHASDDVVGWELNNRIAIRKGDWKLIRIPGRFGSGDWELYNIPADPAERNDLSKVNVTKLNELIAEWEKYAADNGVILAP
ncbi:arylsulfatase [Pseudemcibacter aquimaris]|uniref:arylsulfatase n=1 Tax=Pseudemcibacter aquimaris TaxID=2857064 RepID=UPI00201211E2|nr:arylsulfatase [Pseudemcibacter aquimaris]MCC3860505.1 arylsulfatase [Pseudemcibacter aquimaris]WDU59330.1 arylsulfatase [Pseudemcibacter aquimaris]